MHEFKPGDTFYYFTVQRVLGAGYHGSVYEIRHRETGDLFALKTMHGADTLDPNKTARALVGAKGNYGIDHRNVVKVLDLNCEANGLVWMRTELLRGYTIQEVMARQGRLSLPFALATAIEAAYGLHAIHEAKIIHRDVKPSNLFYTEGRAVKVIDLSLAKVFPEGLQTTLGRLGLGTPAYSAPEQLEGRVSPDVRFDVYGLGITLWEMLAGHSPFHDVLHDMQALLKRQLTAMPPRLSDVALLPTQVDEVVRRAIAKDPGERYGSMMEMARALMDLNAWVEQESRAHRIVVVVPRGEPPVPGDTNAWRQSRVAQITPSHASPPSGPRARVILAGPTRGRPALAATERMTEEPSEGAASCETGSLAGRSAKILALRGTEILPTSGAIERDPPRKTELPLNRASQLGTADMTTAVRRPQWRPLPPPPASEGVPRETPPAVARSEREPRVRKAPGRAPWTWVIAAVATVSAASFGVVFGFQHRRIQVGNSAPAPASPKADGDMLAASAANTAPAAPAVLVTEAAPSISAVPSASTTQPRRARGAPPARFPDAPSPRLPMPPSGGRVFGVDN